MSVFLEGSTLLCVLLKCTETPISCEEGYSQRLLWLPWSLISHVIAPTFVCFMYDAMISEISLLLAVAARKKVASVRKWKCYYVLLSELSDLWNLKDQCYVLYSFQRSNLLVRDVMGFVLGACFPLLSVITWTVWVMEPQILVIKSFQFSDK